MSISVPQAKNELLKIPSPSPHSPKLEDQSVSSFLSSALSPMQTQLETLSEFISSLQTLLPMIPEPLNAVLSTDILTLFLHTHFPSNPFLYSLLKTHFSRIIAFLSDLHPASYQDLHMATHMLCNYILGFISSLTLPSLSTEQFFVIFVCSELFTLIQKIPLAFVIEIVTKAQLRISDPKASTALPSLYSLICNKKVPFLPNYLHKGFTLVLDLDETLGHMVNGVFLKRPGVEVFISEMSKIYELVLFTAASQEYADQAMKLVDPESLVFLRLYREHVTGQGVKDLEDLGRDLNRVIIIDNFSKSFERQPKNGIEIKPWLGDQRDQELVKLMLPLKEIPLVRGKHLFEMLEIINGK